jgi:hypothetical protein
MYTESLPDFTLRERAAFPEPSNLPYVCGAQLRPYCVPLPHGSPPPHYRHDYQTPISGLHHHPTGGNLAVVHRCRDPDRRGAADHQRRDVGRAGRRRLAVGGALPADRAVAPPALQLETGPLSARSASGGELGCQVAGCRSYWAAPGESPAAPVTPRTPCACKPGRAIVGTIDSFGGSDEFDTYERILRPRPWTGGAASAFSG